MNLLIHQDGDRAMLLHNLYQLESYFQSTLRALSSFLCGIVKRRDRGWRDLKAALAEEVLKSEYDAGEHSLKEAVARLPAGTLLPH